MGGTFLAVQRKLDWAKHQVGAVGERIQRFEESEGRPFSAEPHPRAGTKQAIQVRWSPATTEAVPLDDLGHLVGDAVHNLRATLDYLVYELHVRRNQGREPVELPRNHPWRKTQFPIFLDDLEYEGKAGRGAGARNMIAGLTIKQRALIKKLQPFRDPNHPLWLLSELDNLSKHRHAHVFVRLDWVELDLSEAARFGFKTVEGIKPRRRYKDGAKVTLLTQPRRDYNPSRIEAQVNVALKRDLSVVFDERSPAKGRDVVGELRRLQGHVTRTVTQFRRFLPYG